MKLFANKQQIITEIDPSLVKNRKNAFYQQMIKFKVMVKGSYFGELEIVLKQNRLFEAQCETKEARFYYINRNVAR